MARNYTDWVETFLTYSANRASPELFRRWCAITLIAGVLERRVWVKTARGLLYPNIYTVLVGPPGVGKTIMTSAVQSFWNGINKEGSQAHFFIAPSSVTGAAIIDDLKDSERFIVKFGEPTVKFNALAICSNELSVLLPEWDSSLMAKLTDIYDGFAYSERRRGRDINFKIEHPIISMLAATTPSFLTEVLPPGAWDQGFLSRTFLVYSGEVIRSDLWSEVGAGPDVVKKLQADLDSIFELYGPITFTEQARDAIGNWHMNPQPVPEHPRLMNYNTRRTAHLLKLCMIACVSAGDTMQVNLDHYRTALGWLLELELYLPDIFKAAVNGGATRAIDECWHFAYAIYMKENQPVVEGRLVEFLAARVAIHEVSRVLEVMERAKLLKPELIAGVGKAYMPRPRRNI